jgi:hypothetical protein
VTRDLSSARRAAILRWLQNLGPDGKPLLGEAAPAPAVRAEEAVAAPPVEAAELEGGKTLAASRRLMLRSGRE